MRKLLIAMAAAVTAAALSVPGLPASAGTGRWSGSWGAAPQQPAAGVFAPNWSQAGFAAQSVRQVVRLSTGGAAVRIRLSNAYGATPLKVHGASLARAGAGAALRPGTLRPVTFGHAAATVIPAGAETVSDPVPLPATALDRLAVTLYFAAPTGPATYHDIASATSYRAGGDRRFDPRGTAFTGTTASWYYLTGVDVLGPARSVVAFGDSITDGTGSTQDAANRYPDQLAERLAATGRRLGVVNSGISGNRLLNGSPCFGERASARFRRDVLDRPGVRSVIVMEGINDIGYSLIPGECTSPNPEVSAAQIIDGHRALIRAAHAAGIRIIGGTIVPFKGSYFDVGDREQVRDAVNAWIRTSGEYDAVVDFEHAVADPADPDRLRPEYDVRDGRPGDGLHPNDAGLDAMAAAVDLNSL
ncbi:SGNH/GDSL hydrolase family protein [Nonomuraea zeae]|uniref:SGNH/GDSL hydrolase family protein n=1 Tax=Nonomuraea zeae TaxID=1642303 RepID=A0A5S4GL98_9ACTN|nr:SGNH/GDSL hydrolase family protein [Nonomuraea zeae]TMR33552.1 SGNH/GDSL hydrolase family protein [Nonomuraea zeae]